MIEPLTLQWFALWAAAIGVVAVDVSKTKVFAWLRASVGRYTYRSRSNGTLEAYLPKWRGWLWNLLRCPWCLSHWLATAVCIGHGQWNPLWWLALTGASAVPMCVYSALLWLIEDPRLGHD